MGEAPVLSVIVATRDRPASLAACIRSLEEQTLASSRYEVIVVDNGSTPETRREVAMLATAGADIHLLFEDRAGASRARNRGVARARGRIVAFIDDDGRAREDWCAGLVAAFDGDPPPDGVGGRILPVLADGVRVPRWYSPEFETRTWGEQARWLEGGEASHGFSGSNMALRRALFLDVGGFDESFGPGTARPMGEEAQLFARLARGGAKLWYSPEVVVYHEVKQRLLSVRGRMGRGFEVGRALAATAEQDGNRGWRRRLRVAGGWALYPLRGVARVITAERLTTEMVKVLQEYAMRTGYLVGTLRG